jgi:hypothetical protein
MAHAEYPPCSKYAERGLLPPTTATQAFGEFGKQVVDGGALPDKPSRRWGDHASRPRRCRDACGRRLRPRGGGAALSESSRE